MSKTAFVYFKIFVLLATIIANTGAVLSHPGTCKQIDGSSRCCKGRQVHCRGRNMYTSFLASASSKMISTCFCDEYCTLTNDCCADYRNLCVKPKIDCKVSNWNRWSHCTNKCGKGSQNRTRSILVKAQNGGISCPLLAETRKCQGRVCPNNRYGRSGSRMLELMDFSSEVANLLPDDGDVEQKIRRFDRRWDIRRKLYLLDLIRQNKTETKDPEPYCIHYEIIQVNSACERSSPNFRNQDHRNLLYQTSNFDEHRTNSAIRNLPRKFATSYSKAQLVLQPHKRICATCYPQYMEKNLGNRCPGSGYPGIVSRWRALQTEDCQGTFRMVSNPRRGCNCHSGLNSYILT